MPPWNWDLIDLPRSFGLAALYGAVSLLVGLLSTSTRGTAVDLTTYRSWPSWRSGINPSLLWPTTATLFVGLAGGTVLLGSLRYKGLYNEVTAGWTQAVGAILAILAVVLADQATNARAERARRRAISEAASARLAAIREAHVALTVAAQEAGTFRVERREPHPVSEITIERVAAAGSVLDYYMSQAIELDDAVVTALARTVQVFAQPMTEVVGPGAWHSAETAATLQAQLHKAAARIESILDGYEHRVFAKAISKERES